MSQRGSWEAARPCLLSLEATACVSSSRWCLGKRGRQAAGGRREDPLCLQAGRSPLLPAWAPSPLSTQTWPLSPWNRFMSLEVSPGSATSGEPQSLAFSSIKRGD